MKLTMLANRMQMSILSSTCVVKMIAYWWSFADCSIWCQLFCLSRML